jgi:hypothetical protein
LDYARSWIIATEGNAFMWPGPDLRLVPSRQPPTIYYGPLPPKLFKIVIERVVKLARGQKFHDVARAP